MTWSPITATASTGPTTRVPGTRRSSTSAAAAARARETARCRGGADRAKSGQFDLTEDSATVGDVKRGRTRRRRRRGRLEGAVDPRPAAPLAAAEHAVAATRAPARVGHATPEVIDEIAAVYRVPVLDERPEVPNVGEVFVTFAGQMASSSRRSRRRCSRSRRPRSCSARRRSGRSRSVRSRRSRSATCPSQSHELVLHVMSLRCSSYAPTR
jgi:hypothetical protein